GRAAGHEAPAQEAPVSQRAAARGSQALDGQGLREIRATFHLDGDLPDGARAQQSVIRRVRDRGPGRRTEQPILIDVPDQGVRIDQELHSMYSLKSSSGASKSGAMYRTEPRRNPGGSGIVGRPAAVSRATGRSSSVMTISSPGANRWISSDRLD